MQSQLNAGVRRQHLWEQRQGYDGHNRRSVLIPMRRYRLRRHRRAVHNRLRDWAHSYIQRRHDGQVSR
jgi:hypothetical protein